jgi:glycosyltransferase involved in cell wall biosynthesis
VKRFAGREDVFLIDRIMPRREVTSLIEVCDCFVSLHRAEGFGLGPAEAMSLAKPAIVTNWSGSVDYMTADNSIAIDYALVKLGQGLRAVTKRIRRGRNPTSNRPLTG